MTTRRSFLTGAAGLCGAAALPAWAGLPKESNDGPRSVLLFTDRAGARVQGVKASTILERCSLSLDGAALVEGAGLADAGHSALVALGTPAAVFALRSQLGSHWRVIVQGLHGADGRGVHRLESPAFLASLLSSVIAEADSEEAFASVLASLSGRARHVSLEQRTTRRLHSPRWNGTARASLLAWPTRIA